MFRLYKSVLNAVLLKVSIQIVFSGFVPSSLSLVAWLYALDLVCDCAWEESESVAPLFKAVLSATSIDLLMWGGGMGTLNLTLLMLLCGGTNAVAGRVTFYHYVFPRGVIRLIHDGIYNIWHSMVGGASNTEQLSESKPAYKVAPSAHPQITQVVRQNHHQGVCRVCGDRLSSKLVVACPECQTLHHCECFTYNNGCAIFGCKKADASKVTFQKDAGSAENQHKLTNDSTGESRATGGLH